MDDFFITDYDFFSKHFTFLDVVLFGLARQYCTSFSFLLTSLQLTDENKLYDISNKLVMGVIGDAGDRVQLTQFIEKNVQLYKMRNGYPLDIAAVVHFTRKTMLGSLRGGVGIVDT